MVWTAVILFLLSAVDAKVLEASLLIIVCQPIELSVAVFNFTLSVDPFLAVLTLNPSLAVSVSILPCLNVDLSAEITVLIVLVCVAASLTKPEELAFAKFPSRPLASVAAKRFQLAKLISASSQPPFRD